MGAEHNKMQVNIAKTKEIVFHRPNARKDLFPSELPGIKRVLCAKLLGVWLQADVGMKKHVDYILHICNQRTYLLTQLKRQGLPQTQLLNVVDAIIPACVLYASSAWRAYLNAADINSCNSCLLKQSDGKLSQTMLYDASQLIENCDMTLFKSSLNINHCLRHIYPD